MVTNRRGAITALLLAIGIAPTAGAATYTVDTPTDEQDTNTADGLCQTASGHCSLRAAIQQANATAEADVITLPAGLYELSITGQSEDAAATGDLDITSELVINGAGADVTLVDGMKSDRVFQVLKGGNATLNALTIQNGSANVDGVGGGLSNRGGVVTLNDCNVYRNSGAGFGGGLDNSSFGGMGTTDNSMGIMTVNRCTISNNMVFGNGGGVANNDGVLIINDSTIRDNGSPQPFGLVQGGGIYNSSSLQLPGSTIKAKLEVNRTLITGHDVINDGGGIYHLIGNMTITNSTISGNSAKRNGGGIFIANTLTALSTNRIVHTTITDNIAYGNDTSSQPIGFGGGGLFNGNPSNKSGTVVTYLENSLIAANGFGGNCYNIGQLIKSGNFISDDSCLNAGETPSGTTYTTAQIGLDTLKDNGGPTLTHALLSGSLAIDAGDSVYCESVDQRSYSRSGSCDAGAFELAGVAPATPVQAPPAPPGTLSTDGQNHAPLSFPMPFTAVAGQPLHGVLNGADSDGDPLTYKIVSQPTKGQVGLDAANSSANNIIPGSFTYTADATVSGVDSFTYEVCDTSNACSAPAMISISISAGVAVNEEVIAVVSPGTGTASSVNVVSGQNLDAIAPDTDPSISYPLGAFFFSVKDIPTDTNTQLNGVVVTLQLPAGTVISSDAVLRKLDKNGVWQNLAAGPNSQVTTGTIDPVAKTITLVLRDNDQFDTDPTLGAITDPVALAVTEAVPAVLPTTNDASPSSSGGGGAVNLLALAALLLLGGSRRFRY